MTTTTPDPLALAEEAEKAICNRVRGKDRDYGPLTNREYQDILALASAIRAAHEENARLREALERIRDGAGSNTVPLSDYADYRAHTFGGIYRIAASVVGERDLSALAGGKGEG